MKLVHKALGGNDHALRQHLCKRNRNRLHPVIRKALEILRTTDVSGMHHGKYPLDGDKLILQINEITTGPKETKRLEVHAQYIDVQYMVHGHELIGFYLDCHDGAVLGGHLADNDVLFDQERSDIHGIMLPMTGGCHAVFFPKDVHCPCCMMPLKM